MTSSRTPLPHHLLGAPLLAGLVLLGAACTSESETAAPELDLSGDWVLRAGRVDGTELPATAGTGVTLVADRGQVSGTSACNAYFGDVTVVGESVTFGGLGSTDMACEPDVMEVERSYLAALAAVTTAERIDNHLLLAGPGVELEFRPQADVDTEALAGTTWHRQR